MNKKEIEKIVKDYITKNPKIIEDAVKEYLEESLSVNVEASSSYECSREYNTISVEVKLDNKAICSDSDSVRVN